MAEASILKEFLAVLGFKVDDASYSKFEKGLGEATKRAVQFSAALEVMATTVEAVVLKVADNLDELYWASLRIGSSAENIRAYEYALSQLGGTARGARSALESVAFFLNSNPGAERWLQAMGVQTRTAAGVRRDTEAIMSDMGRRFAQMPQYLAIRRAQMLGIDYNTMLAMERGDGGYTAEYRNFAKSIGVNLNDNTSSANRFMTSVRELRMEVGLLVTKIGGDLIARWGPRLREFLIWLGQHSTEVATRIEGWVQRLARLGEMIFNFVMRVLAVIERMDRATDGWSTTVGALLIVLGPLLATVLPLMMNEVGAIVAAIVALIAALAWLYSDFEKWNRGGKSVIDWSPWASQVRALIKDVGDLGTALGKLATQISADLGPAFSYAFGVGIQWLDDIAKEITHIANALVAARHGDWGTAGREAGAAITESPAGDLIRHAFAHAGGNAAGHLGSARPAAGFGQVQQMLMAMGWSAPQAAAIAANLQAESGFDPNISGDSGAAYGIAQWHHDRQQEFARVMHRPIEGSTLAQQLAFVNYELRQGRYSRYGARLAQMTDAGQATRYVTSNYEAPKDTIGAGNTRAAIAEAAMHQTTLGGSGGHVVVINAKTDINVHGTGDPHTAARAVKNAQVGVYDDTIRNAKGALR